MTYRDSDITNEQAWAAMQTACQNIVRTVLAERKALLTAGFADSHSMCKELDDVARRWSDNEQVVRRDWLYDICPEGHEVRLTPFGFTIVQLVADRTPTPHHDGGAG